MGEERTPKVSVIFSTCFQPVSLKLVLAGYRAQTFKDFELVIGDCPSCAK